MTTSPLIYMIAGEQSGDLLGARLMAALKTRENAIRFAGIGGPLMQAEGMKPRIPMQELALMGFAEIVPHLPRLLNHISATVNDIEARQPDIIVTIDSPGFNFWVAQKLRARGYKGTLIHYVAASVWAYKPERAKKMARLYDHLLTLLPFEPPYFEKEGLRTTFVGHPVAWEWRSKGDGHAFLTRHGIAPDQTVLLLLPGSRKGEITRHLPIMKETLTQLAARHLHLNVVIPVPSRFVESVRKATQKWAVRTIVINSEQEKSDAFAAATVALAKSGTVTLELALAGVPMVVMYRVNPITAWLMRHMLKISTFSLVNILAGKNVIPECIQENCTPEILTREMTTLLTDPAARKRQQQAIDIVSHALGMNDSTSPSEKAAKILWDYLARGTPRSASTC